MAQPPTPDREVEAGAAADRVDGYFLLDARL
jgi:hypothetical protein